MEDVTLDIESIVDHDQMISRESGEFSLGNFANHQQLWVRNRLGEFAPMTGSRVFKVVLDGFDIDDAIASKIDAALSSALLTMPVRLKLSSFAVERSAPS